MKPERAAAEEQAAQEYAVMLRTGADWPTVNRAIIERWSLSALLRVKERAWAIAQSRPARSDDVSPEPEDAT